MALATDREILTLQTAAATCKNTSIPAVQKCIVETTVTLMKKICRSARFMNRKVHPK